MRKSTKCLLANLFFLLISLNSFSQTIKSQSGVERELRAVVDLWFSSASKGDTSTFQSLLTEDFQLLAWGKRNNKPEIMQMVRDFSDIEYKLSNVRSGSGGNTGFMTFDIVMDCKIKGQPTTGHAMETYLFRKENGKWKVHTKTVVMIEDQK